MLHQLKLQMQAAAAGRIQQAPSPVSSSTQTKACDRVHVGAHVAGLLVPRFYEETILDAMDLHMGGAVALRVNCESRVYWLNNLNFWRQQHGVGGLFGVSNGASLGTGIRFPVWNYNGDMGLNVIVAARAGVASIYYYAGDVVFPTSSHVFYQLAGSAGLTFGGPRVGISVLVDTQKVWGPLVDSTTIGLMTVGEYYFN